jgi:hypothetical protein
VKTAWTSLGVWMEKRNNEKTFVKKAKKVFLDRECVS